MYNVSLKKLSGCGKDSTMVMKEDTRPFDLKINLAKKGNNRVVNKVDVKKMRQRFAFWWSAGHEPTGLLMYSDDDNFIYCLGPKLMRKI